MQRLLNSFEITKEQRLKCNRMCMATDDCVELMSKTPNKRIQAFHDAGIELFMLQFQPLLTEMRTFAAEIFPRVRKITRTPAQAKYSEVVR